jgi:perosamine synthetase
MIRWSPHPRYRLYTGPGSYSLPLRRFLGGFRICEEPAALLEREICRRFDIQAAACVPMARTGLYFALKELLRPGQTVILSPLTIVDVVNMVVLAGGVPVFADIRRSSCAIDPEKAESLINNRTGAVLITHLHGESAGAYDFRAICDRRGIPLIEDTAQAFGAVEKGRRLGTIGDIGIYSFGFYKNVNAWCGGMLVSPNSQLILKIRKRMCSLPVRSGRKLLARSAGGVLTNIATFPPGFAAITYPVLRFALLRNIQHVKCMLDPEHKSTRLQEIPADYLDRMGAAQAAIAFRQLDRVDADSHARIANAAHYDAALSNLGTLITPRKHSGLSHIYTYYPVQFHAREDLLRHAVIHGRDFAAQHLRNCADLPEFREFYRDCPNARAAAAELILLPTYPRYPKWEVQSNIDAIRDFFEKRSEASFPDVPLDKIKLP